MDALKSSLESSDTEYEGQINDLSKQIQSVAPQLELDNTPFSVRDITVKP